MIIRRFQPLAVMLALDHQHAVVVTDDESARQHVMPDAFARRQTEDAPRSLGYGKDMAKARARYRRTSA